MPPAEPHLKLKVQIYLGEEIALGPGKVDLLEAVARTGSISAAGREMGLSYRRAWLLVDTMNRCFAEPLVATAHGGAGGGGARITPAGEDVLHRYRALQATVDAAAAAEVKALILALASQPK
jgi:molybdate transport system regulatory protein